MLTGIGILVSAYGTLSVGITVYHWRIAVYLAWYANLTHQSGLIFLRGYLSNPRRRFQRYIRLFIMGLLAVLLIAAMTPTAYNNNYWSSFSRSPAELGDYAWCFIDSPTATKMFEAYRQEGRDSGMGLRSLKSFETMIISILLLTFTFMSKAIRLSMRTYNLFNNKIRGSVRVWFQQQLIRLTGQDLCHTLDLGHRARSYSQVKLHFLIRPLLALYITGHVYLELFTSMLSEVSLLPPPAQGCSPV